MQIIICSLLLILFVLFDDALFSVWCKIMYMHLLLFSSIWESIHFYCCSFLPITQSVLTWANHRLWIIRVTTSKLSYRYSNDVFYNDTCNCVFSLIFFNNSIYGYWRFRIVAGILLRKQLLTLCVHQFNRRKYALAEGFRQLINLVCLST